MNILGILLHAFKFGICYLGGVSHPKNTTPPYFHCPILRGLTITMLVGGWTNPFEKYARQCFSSCPQVVMKIPKIFETTRSQRPRSPGSFKGVPFNLLPICCVHMLRFSLPFSLFSQDLRDRNVFGDLVFKLVRQTYWKNLLLKSRVCVTALTCFHCLKQIGKDEDFNPCHCLSICWVLASLLSFLNATSKSHITRQNSLFWWDTWWHGILRKLAQTAMLLHHRAGRMLWGFYSDDLQSNTSSSILARLLPLGVHEALGQTQGSIIQLQKDDSGTSFGLQQNAIMASTMSVGTWPRSESCLCNKDNRVWGSCY